VLAGAADTVLAFQRSGGKLKLITKMQKDGGPAPPTWLALKIVQLPDGTTSCVIGAALGAVDGADPDRAEGASDARSLRTDGIVLTALATFGAHGARATEWQQSSHGVGKTAFYAGLARLVAEAKVRQDGNRHFLVEPPAVRRFGTGPNCSLADLDNVVREVSPGGPPFRGPDYRTSPE
jgi:hypothetical protein